MFEILILYVLNKYDATIYRIVKIINELFSAYVKSSTGTINPAIKRLEKLGCVECVEKMSNGGMLSKIYSITPVGKKHLVDLLLSFNSLNPYSILNDSMLAISCCDVLSLSQTIEFKENMQNILELHKIKLEKHLNNEYIDLKEHQKAFVKITIEQTNKILELL